MCGDCRCGDFVVGDYQLFPRLFADRRVFIGDLSRVGLTGITPDSLFPRCEALEWPMVVFHLSFAIITAALVIGSFAERVRPGGVLLFGLLWPVLVCAPVARWVWHSDGWLAKWAISIGPVAPSFTLRRASWV